MIASDQGTMDKVENAISLRPDIATMGYEAMSNVWSGIRNVVIS
jgi:hypothetical protein